MRGAKITRARDANIVPASGPSLNGTRPFTFLKPTVLQYNVYESSANSFYHGFTLSATKRYSRHFLFAANYTLSKALDEVTDYNSDFEATDQLNLRGERALAADMALTLSRRVRWRPTGTPGRSASDLTTAGSGRMPKRYSPRQTLTSLLFRSTHSTRRVEMGRGVCSVRWC